MENPTLKFHVAGHLVSDDAEQRRLRLLELEAVIDSGVDGWVRAGLALIEIVGSRLYRETHSTFEDWVRERHGFSRERAYQLIRAAEVHRRLSTAVHKPPACEWQARELARLDPEQQPAVWGEAVALAGDQEVTERHVRRVLRERRRQQQVQRLAETSAGDRDLPQDAEAYPVVLADPPWRYEHSETASREIENHYPTMSLDEICALPVAEVCTDDAILFMWATSPKLAESIRVIESWGFTYRTCAVWVKDKIGMGYYFRQQHELLLVAARGSPPKPAPADRVSSIIEAARGKHSEKPTAVYEIIERMYPELSRVELFARGPQRAGWSAWGNELQAAAEGDEPGGHEADDDAGGDATGDGEPNLPGSPVT